MVHQTRLYLERHMSEVCNPVKLKKTISNKKKKLRLYVFRQ